jgi:hypothetical protein
MPTLSSLSFLTLLLAVAPTLRAQPTSDARPVSPSAATALSVIVPGGGQIYAGETVKGGLLLVGTGVAIAAGTAASYAASEHEPYFGCPAPCWEFEPTPLLIGAGVAGALWLYGVLDAQGAARRANRRRELATLEIAPAHFATETGGASGLTLRARL